VLAVVRGQQQPAAPQDVGQGLQQGAPGLFADPKNRRGAGDDQVGLAQVGQLDEPRPVGVRYSRYAVGKVTARFRSSTIPQFLRFSDRYCWANVVMRSPRDYSERDVVRVT